MCLNPDAIFFNHLKLFSRFVVSFEGIPIRVGFTILWMGHHTSSDPFPVGSEVKRITLDALECLGVDPVVAFVGGYEEPGREYCDQERTHHWKTCVDYPKTRFDGSPHKSRRQGVCYVLKLNVDECLQADDAYDADAERQQSE